MLQVKSQFQLSRDNGQSWTLYTVSRFSGVRFVHGVEESALSERQLVIIDPAWANTLSRGGAIQAFVGDEEVQIKLR